MSGAEVSAKSSQGYIRKQSPSLFLSLSYTLKSFERETDGVSPGYCDSNAALSISINFIGRGLYFSTAPLNLNGKYHLSEPSTCKNPVKNNINTNEKKEKKNQKKNSPKKKQQQKDKHVHRRKKLPNRQTYDIHSIQP